MAAHFPAPLRDAAEAAVRSAFMTGLHRGWLVAAGTALAAALVVLAFVPTRAASSEARQGEGLGLVRTESADSIPVITRGEA